MTALSRFGRTASHTGSNRRFAPTRPSSRRWPSAVPLSILGLALLLPLLSGGCVSRRTRFGMEPPRSLPSATRLRSLLEQRRDEIRSLRTLARLRYVEGEESSSGKQAILAARPNQLRIEVMSLLGTVFVMTADAERLRALASEEKVLYSGAPSATLMERYARVGMEVNEMIDLLLASPAIRPEDGLGSVDFDEELGAIRLSHRSESTVKRVWFSSELLPIAAARDRFGEVEWYAEFGDYEPRDSVAVAKTVALELPRARRRLEMRFIDPEINASLPSALFQLRAPDGVRVVELEE